MDDVARAYRDIGQNAIRVRRRSGWTQQQIADRMEVETSEIRRYERGGGNMTVKTLVRLAKALDVPVHRLLLPTKGGAARRPGRPRKVPR